MKKIRNTNSKIIICVVAIILLIALAIGAYLTPITRHAVQRLYFEGLDVIQPNVPVLVYHNVSDNAGDNNPMVLDTAEFDKQMKLLYDNKFTTITSDQLYQFMQGKAKLPKKSIYITFDDGYQSNYDYAYPILKKYGFKATIFVITSQIKEKDEPVADGKLKFINKQSMKSASDVIEFGSHSDNLHFIVYDQEPFLLSADPERIEKDMLESKKHITSEVYAYPYGRYNKTAIEMLKKTGFKMAFTTKKGRARTGSNLYEIPRFTISPATTIESFKNIVGEYK